MDWLDEEIALQQSNDLLPQISMSSIYVHIWHTKNKNTISFSKELVDICNNTNTIPYHEINSIIKKYEYVNDTRYRPIEYFILNIDIDEKNAVELAMLDISNISHMIQEKYIKPLQLYQSIFVNPSVRIFHSFNAIFIIMEELKPILKSLHYTKRIRHSSGGGGGGGSGREGSSGGGAAGNEQKRGKTMKITA
jgi:uncharacterized membrane protein YgcG